MEPCISIIIPVYNCEKDIKRCLQSIVDQTYKQFEVIVVNDGSTDNTLKMIQQVIDDDCRFLVINQPNQGVSAARNRGIDAARGSYLMFVDGDDYLLKHACQIVDMAQKESEAELILTGFEQTIIQTNGFTETNQRFPLTWEGGLYSASEFLKVIPERFDKNVIHTVSAKFYKKSIIDEYHIRFDKQISIGEDLLFNLQYYRHITKVRWEPSCSYHYAYKVDSGSLSTRVCADTFSQKVILYEKAVVFFDEMALSKCKQVLRKTLFLDAKECTGRLVRRGGTIKQVKEIVVHPVLRSVIKDIGCEITWKERLFQYLVYFRASSALYFLFRIDKNRRRKNMIDKY